MRARMKSAVAGAAAVFALALSGIAPASAAALRPAGHIGGVHAFHGGNFVGARAWHGQRRFAGGYFSGGDYGLGNYDGLAQAENDKGGYAPIAPPLVVNIVSAAAGGADHGDCIIYRPIIGRHGRFLGTRAIRACQ